MKALLAFATLKVSNEMTPKTLALAREMPHGIMIDKLLVA